MKSSEPKTTPQFRRANFSDRDFICRMIVERSRAHHIEEPYGILYDQQTAVCTVSDVIKKGVALVGPNSCAGAMLGAFPWNREAVIAQVLFYHFSKAREMGILVELARLCEWAGATHMNCSSHFPGNVIGRYYQRIGLKPVETQWLAPLNNICKPAGK